MPFDIVGKTYYYLSFGQQIVVAYKIAKIGFVFQCTPRTTITGTSVNC